MLIKTELSREYWELKREIRKCEKFESSNVKLRSVFIWVAELGGNNVICT